MRHIGRISCCASLILLSACMQDPVGIEYKGDEFFGRVHEGALDSPNHEIYPENSPRIKQDYVRPVEQVQIQSVGVTDLPPPKPGQQQLTSQDNGAPSSSPDQAQAAHAPQGGHFIWPVADGKVIAHFGPKVKGASNDGINISVDEGEPIWAAAGGMIVYAANELERYGNMVIIRHDGGWMTAYAHARSLTVSKNDKVRQGDVIGYVGMTGGVKSPQLHFAIRDGRTPVDPELYLPKNIAAGDTSGVRDESLDDR